MGREVTEGDELRRTYLNQEVSFTMKFNDHAHLTIYDTSSSLGDTRPLLIESDCVPLRVCAYIHSTITAVGHSSRRRLSRRYEHVHLPVLSSARTAEAPLVFVLFRGSMTQWLAGGELSKIGRAIAKVYILGFPEDLSKRN